MGGCEVAHNYYRFIYNDYDGNDVFSSGFTLALGVCRHWFGKGKGRTFAIKRNEMKFDFFVKRIRYFSLRVLL